MMASFNNSQEIDNFVSYRHLKLIINLCTLSSSIFAIFVSLLIITFICINYVLKTNLNKTNNVSLLLTCNTCVAIICSSSSLTLMVLSTVGGDLNILILKRITHWNCYLRGYLHFVFINSIYLSYVLQAGFRLFRIAFHKCKCIRSICSFSYYIITQWTCSFLLILPILFGHKNYTSLIVYLPDDFYCQVPMTSIRGIIFSILSVYFVPLCCIGIIHSWIIICIRRTNGGFARTLRIGRRKDKRDAIIIKRICMVMIVLLSLGIPSSAYVIVFIVTGHLHWTSYRVGWMTISLSFAFISLSSLYVTPQIYKPMRILFKNSKPITKRPRPS